MKGRVIYPGREGKEIERRQHSYFREEHEGLVAKWRGEGWRVEKGGGGLRV